MDFQVEQLRHKAESGSSTTAVLICEPVLCRLPVRAEPVQGT